MPYFDRNVILNKAYLVIRELDRSALYYHGKDIWYQLRSVMECRASHHIIWLFWIRQHWTQFHSVYFVFFLLFGSYLKIIIINKKFSINCSYFSVKVFHNNKEKKEKSILEKCLNQTESKVIPVLCAMQNLNLKKLCKTISGGQKYPYINRKSTNL